MRLKEIYWNSKPREIKMSFFKFLMVFIFLSSANIALGQIDNRQNSRIPILNLSKQQALVRAMNSLVPAQTVLQSYLINFYTRGGLQLTPNELPKPVIHYSGLSMGLPLVYVYSYNYMNQNNLVSFTFRRCGSPNNISFYKNCREILGYPNNFSIIKIVYKDKLENGKRTGCYINFEIGGGNNLFNSAVVAEYKNSQSGLGSNILYIKNQYNDAHNDEYRLYPHYVAYKLIPTGFEVKGCQ
jgi:hypothetical protein